MHEIMVFVRSICLPSFLESFSHSLQFSFIPISLRHWVVSENYFRLCYHFSCSSRLSSGFSGINSLFLTSSSLGKVCKIICAIYMCHLLWQVNKLWVSFYLLTFQLWSRMNRNSCLAWWFSLIIMELCF